MEVRLEGLFDKWCKKLRISPQWDVKLEMIQDPEWRKTGDFKIDPTDRNSKNILDIFPAFYYHNLILQKQRD